ncbi:MAG: hypothetical protein GVY29_11745 [Spirochaetes bacterium]|jgi:outer membrane protein assembly factor BamB|nr:hypothetical protein [Spirochaetota bacterium]
MVRNRLRTVLGILAAASTVALVGCMDASLSQSVTAPASINIQDAPSAIEAFDVEISGGTNTAQTVTGDTEALVLELAVGEEHTIDLDSNNFLGTKSFIVPQGGLQLSVPVQEKIFIPDAANGRLVMIDDMEGTDWTTNVLMDRYVDAEVGPDGRIYTTVRSSGEYFVQAYDSIDDTEPAEIVTASPNDWLYAVGIDWDREYLYYGGVDGDTGTPRLRRVSLSGTGEINLDDLVGSGEALLEQGVYGIAVDASGDIYVSGAKNEAAFAGDAPRVVKIDPSSASQVWVSDPLPTEQEAFVVGTDVIFKNGVVYVNNPDGLDGYKIVQLDAQTGKIMGHFGSAPGDTSNPRPGEFYAPNRFVAVSRTNIFITDDGVSANVNRLISFEPGTDASGWKTFGSQGSGKDEFDFFTGG